LIIKKGRKQIKADNKKIFLKPKKLINIPPNKIEKAINIPTKLSLSPK
jgi:hypothetical protein